MIPSFYVVEKTILHPKGYLGLERTALVSFLSRPVFIQVEVSTTTRPRS